MKRRSKAFVLLLCVAALGAGGAAGAAEKDELTLRALTGPKGGDVTITVPAASGGAAVESFEHVQVTLTPPEGADDPSTSVLNLKDVPADSGVANVVLGPLESGTHLEVQVHVREAKPPRTTILRGDTIVKLRPDLVVAAVDAPPQTLSTRPIDVVADIDELNGETGAKATLTLMLGPTPVADPKSITVPAGGSLTVAFEGVKLETAMSAELDGARGRRRAL